MLRLRFVIGNHSGTDLRMEVMLACPVSAIVISASSRGEIFKFVFEGITESQDIETRTS